MALSQRLRFEILRRDNHKCKYCGRSTPEVVLSVDHVKPVALGGGDEPSNLVTACRDCNIGKSSSTPDQQIVEEVDQAALKWSAAMAQAAEELLLSYESQRKEIHDTVLNEFPRYYYDRIPADFADDVDKFLAAGLPEDTIVQMARIAATKRGVSKRWSYFCGCCWKQITQLQERAMQIVEAQEPATDSERDIAVMDEADELELIH